MLMSPSRSIGTSGWVYRSRRKQPLCAGTSNDIKAMLIIVARF